MKKIAKRLLISLLACIMGLIPWLYGRYFNSDSEWVWILRIAFIFIVFIIHDLLDAYFKDKEHEKNEDGN